MQRNVRRRLLRRIFGIFPLQNEFLRRRRRDFLSKKEQDASCRKLEKVIKAKASIAVQSGLFLLYPFSSDSSALRISFFSGNPAHSLLAEIVQQGRMPKMSSGGGTPESGERGMLAGCVADARLGHTPRKRGKASRPVVQESVLCPARSSPNQRQAKNKQTFSFLTCKFHICLLY